MSANTSWRSMGDLWEGEKRSGDLWEREKRSGGLRTRYNAHTTSLQFRASDWGRSRSIVVIFEFFVGAQMAEKADPCTEGSLTVVVAF